MTTETVASTQAATPAAPPPDANASASAPAGTTGQGDSGQSLLSTPPAAKAGDSPPKDETKAGEAVTAAEGEAPAGEAAKAPPADIQLTLPEGFVPNEEALSEFKALAKESGLQGESAQKLFNLYAKQESAREAEARAQQEVQSAEWVKAARADAEVGGAKFDENLAVARKGIRAFGSPALLKLLDESGLGNHPELIRAFVRVGKATSEDSIQGAPSQGGVGSEEASHRALYPTMFRKG